MGFSDRLDREQTLFSLVSHIHFSCLIALTSIRPFIHTCSIALNDFCILGISDITVNKRDKDAGLRIHIVDENNK